MLDQFLVHTGRTNRIKGSEHSIDEEFQPMEVNPNFLKNFVNWCFKTYSYNVHCIDSFYNHYTKNSDSHGFP